MPPSEGGSIFQCGREITREQLSEILETVGLFPSLSRKELAATICEHLGWVTLTGNNKLDACTKLLEKLENKGLVRLPAKQEQYRRNRIQRPIVLTSRTDRRASISGNLKDIGQVSVEVVVDRESTGLWNEYVSRYHYLGYKQPFGYFLRYFIESEQGILGCLLFAGAAKALGVRDRWIGWREPDRLRNLAWVINNSRFLIFPWVSVKNLASHVLGQVDRRIKDDWHQRWGYSPVLMETFIDPGHFAGSCYKAANWQYLGMTTGEGLVRKGKRYRTSPKMILVKPLVKDFRSLLCSQQLKGRVEK
ncbi:MAG: DUF4338 domain-containing protein [Aestuariibacter sp.]|nr:DUF4338 domain-containing protein [Aestuariibacter sp.]